MVKPICREVEIITAGIDSIEYVNVFLVSQQGKRCKYYPMLAAMFHINIVAVSGNANICSDID
ncbi:MAG: hypothetical protein JW745_06190 [Sedimentisphaerales bacterium]|nr:hypothetical protein [Sedimentisphaerales bacterium]MBN2841514.1 hypothetical protein [Sedimentisphaerales bacterium]